MSAEITKAELAAYSRQLAGLLCCEQAWRLDEVRERACAIRRDDGMRLWVFARGYPPSAAGRVEIKVESPEGPNGRLGWWSDENLIRCAVGFAQGPAHAAEHVRRRLLPRAEPLWHARSQDAIKLTLEHDQRDRLLDDLLVLALGERLAHGEHRGAVYADGLHAEIDTLDSDGCVSFKLSGIPPEHAHQIARIIADAVRYKNDREKDRAG